MRVGMVVHDPMPGSDYTTIRDFYNNNLTVRATELDDGRWGEDDDFAYRVTFFSGGAQTMINYDLELEREEEIFD